MPSSSSSSSSSSPSRLAFGSCNSQNLKQPLWSVIESRRPTAFVWGGDAIYADHVTGLDLTQLPLPRPLLSCATPSRLSKYYAQQHSNPYYQSFLRSNSNLTIFGTLDDHDYGCNNGDKLFEYKSESAMQFLNFVGESSDSLIWKRARKGWGVYGVKVFDFGDGEGRLVSDEDAGIDPDGIDEEEGGGAAPHYSIRSVAVFVLDVRSNKTPWGEDATKKDYHGDFLGERQWHWFETALRRSKASVNVVVNGLQVHSERYPDGNLSEEWSKYPTAQQRMYEAVMQPGVKAPIFVSGDVHLAQLLRRDCHRRRTRKGGGGDVRSLMEVTTSGLTHSWGTCFSPRLNHHTSWYSFYSYFVSRTIMSYLHWVCPWMELMVSSGEEEEGYETGGYENAKNGKQFALDLNFAEMEFDWEQQSVTVRVMGKDYIQTETPLLSAKWSFDQLSGERAMPHVQTLEQQQHQHQQHQSDFKQEWTCLPYRGTAHPQHVAFGHTSGLLLLTVLMVLPWFSVFGLCVWGTRRCCRECRVKAAILKKCV